MLWLGFILGSVSIYGALHLLLRHFAPRWSTKTCWWACCAGPALLSVGFAVLFVASTPPISEYDPTRDPNYGRWNVLVEFVFGLLVPSGYLLITTPLHILLRRRAIKP